MIKIAIAGYGNLGKGVEAAVVKAPDMELVGIFTRRSPQGITSESGVKVLPFDDLWNMEKDIDVVINCMGSATDLPETTPLIASKFNVVDSFDTHANIPEHFDKVNEAALSGGKIGIISSGWDPGLFSLMRIYMESTLPEGKTYTFWGRGVSQGHSDALRRIPGVKDARQYTVPVEASMEKVRRGEEPVFETRDMHTRECFVVAAEDGDKDAIEKQIVEMPNYFADYNTSVTFIDEEELENNHKGLPHAGNVIRSGVTGLKGQEGNTLEFSLKLDSNPLFTGSVLAATARAAYRLYEKGETGGKTVLDIPPAFYSPEDMEELRKHIL